MTTQKTKKARYIYQALENPSTYNQVIERVKSDRKPYWYISDVNIRTIMVCMENKGYIKRVKVGKYLTRSRLREISIKISCNCIL